MEPSLILYHYWRSSCSWRVRWALNHKKLNFKSVIIDLLAGDQESPSFRKVNPAGMIPTLVDQKQNMSMSESHAILEWLEEKFPQHPLLPTSADDRVLVRQLALLVIAGTQPLQNLKVLKYSRPTQSERETFAAYWIREGLCSYEKTLHRYSCAGTYSLGSQLTIADLCLVPQVYNAHRYGVDVRDFPLSQAIYQRCLMLEECKKASPEAWQPTR